MASMPTFPILDQAALALFLLVWIAYQPALKWLTRRRRRTINSDLTVIRTAWMRNMAERDNRFLDGQLLGHVLNSASFFASTSLIVMAAVAGALFGGEAAYRGLKAAPLLAAAPRLLLEIKLGLVLVTLGRGLLDFIWSIRQLNYTLALIGSAPPLDSRREVLRAYGQAAADILNPALSSFNSGVRGYYFALAAAAWLLGPVPMIVGVLGSTVLLVFRQVGSSSAAAVAKVRDLLDETGAAPEG